MKPVNGIISFSNFTATAELDIVLTQPKEKISFWLSSSYHSLIVKRHPKDEPDMIPEPLGWLIKWNKQCYGELFQVTLAKCTYKDTPHFR